MAGLSEFLSTENSDELAFSDAAWTVGNGAENTQTEASEYELAGVDQFVF